MNKAEIKRFESLPECQLYKLAHKSSQSFFG